MTRSKPSSHPSRRRARETDGAAARCNRGLDRAPPSGASFAPVLVPVWWGRRRSAVARPAPSTPSVCASARVLRSSGECSASLAQGVWHPVVLRVHHRGRSLVRARIFDGVPTQIECEGLPVAVVLRPGTELEVRYRLRSKERGDTRVDDCHVLQRSPWQLLASQRTAAGSIELRVFPNFAPVLRLGTARGGFAREPPRHSGAASARQRDELPPAPRVSRRRPPAAC